MDYQDGMGRLFTEDEVREIVAEAVAPLLARIAELEAEVARLKKDSSNSSKPPSSDIVKPPRESSGGRRKKRRRGGQPGHRRHSRVPFTPEQIDKTWIYEWDSVPVGWKPVNRFRIVQQVELVERPYVVTEHRARLYRNERTGRLVAAPLPKEVAHGGLLGPRLTALVAYQKGACHMSFESIRKFFLDVLHLPISHGQLVKTTFKVSAAMKPSYDELQQSLPRQAHLGIDETGHRERGRRLWSWCFHAPGKGQFTWFHIDQSRGSKVLKRLLGRTFRGIIGCDYYAAYRKFLREADVWLQFCWAHLIRDVKFLTTLNDGVTRRYGQRLLLKIKALFRVWHRRDTLDESRWCRAIQVAKQEVLAVVSRAPQRSEAKNLAKRFRDHGEHYFTFLNEPGVEPTNNGTERQIRFLTIDRKITQGTRGERGRRWCERIWTTLATCSQQNRSAFDFLHQAISAHFNDQPPPTLLPVNP
jgi:transposase